MLTKKRLVPLALIILLTGCGTVKPTTEIISKGSDSLASSNEETLSAPIGDASAVAAGEIALYEDQYIVTRKDASTDTSYTLTHDGSNWAFFITESDGTTTAMCYWDLEVYVQVPASADWYKVDTYDVYRVPSNIWAFINPYAISDLEYVTTTNGLDIYQGLYQYEHDILCAFEQDTNLLVTAKTDDFSLTCDSSSFDTFAGAGTTKEMSEAEYVTVIPSMEFN